MSITTNRLDMTVAELKLKIQDTYLIPANDQNLFFSGERLENSRQLSAYGIGHNSTLEIAADRNDHHDEKTLDQGYRNENKARETQSDNRDWVGSGVKHWDENVHEEALWMNSMTMNGMVVELLLFVVALYPNSY
jgi:hypothetical protein